MAAYVGRVVLLIPIGFFALFGLLFVALEYPLRRQGYRASRQPPDVRPQHSFVPSTSQRFRGGERVGWFNATFPLVTLTVDDRWACIDGFKTVWIDRDAVVCVRHIWTLLGGGLRFDTEDGRYDGVIFWCLGWGAALIAFDRFSWPIERSKTR